MSNWTDDYGHQLIGVHEVNTCHGPHCPIHNPSEHPLNRAKQRWNMQKAIMERICTHDIAHPDPDDYKAAAITRLHGCDGCCIPIVD